MSRPHEVVLGVEIIPRTSLREETAFLDGAVRDTDDGESLAGEGARTNREELEIGRRGRRFVFDHTVIYAIRRVNGSPGTRLLHVRYNWKIFVTIPRSVPKRGQNALRSGHLLPRPICVIFGNDLRLTRVDGDSPVTNAFAAHDAAHSDGAILGVEDAERVRHGHVGGFGVFGHI